MYYFDKNRIKAIILFTVFVFCNSIIFAQEKTELFSVERITIDSEILKESREMSVFLPADYNTNKDNYPVLFLLDGKTHFQHAISAANYLSLRTIIPKLIIVSIHNIDRNRDFSPVYQERFPTSGGAENFINFISEELKPYLNKEYRISKYSVLMGHSLGGTFATYSLLTKPDLFNGYIAISPYLQYDDNYLVNLAEEKLKARYKNEEFFYMSVGDEPDYYSAHNEFFLLVKEKSGDDINIIYEKMENENHGTIPYVSLFNGLRFVFADWQLPQSALKDGLLAIDNHYRVVSKKYGVKQQTPENLINVLGYGKLQIGDREGALEIFNENAKRFPNSANVYDSLGEAYETNNQLELAKENYSKACKLGEKNGDANLAVYRKNLERVKN